jgi:hypothetical protein
VLVDADRSGAVAGFVHDRNSVRDCHDRNTVRPVPTNAVDTTGYRRCTVAEITAEFGVTRPAIYRHLDKISEVGMS